MKAEHGVAVIIGLLAVGCTGSGFSATITVVRPAAISVRQSGPSEAVVEPGGEGGQWFHSVIRDAGGTFCAKLDPPGFDYSFSDTSDTGLTMVVTCQADHSRHRIRVIFVSDNAPSLSGPSNP
jgi:hypothetical protein